MNDLTPDTVNNTSKNSPAGNLTDFVAGANKDNPLDIEIAVDTQGRVVLFHDKEFTQEISWYEYKIENCQLNFIIGDGEIRDIGLPLAPQISKHMQNSHQILTILMDDESGETVDSRYIPLIIHAE